MAALSETTGLQTHVNDRAGLSLFGSILLHHILIFSIRFVVVSEKPTTALPTLRFTIVNALTEKPEKATALAQHNQSGSGTESASSVVTTLLPMTRNPLFLISETSVISKTNPKEFKSTRSITTSKSHLTLLDGKSVTLTENQAIQNAAKQIAILIFDSPLAGEFDTPHQQSQELKRHTFITSSTRESKFAAYMETWRIEVERIGTLNYPDVAKQLGANGSVVLDLAIGRDGDLQETRLIKSSGDKRLDDAAIRIAQLAAPFDPLPVDILRDTDILHITRIWEFQNNAKLITR